MWTLWLKSCDVPHHEIARLVDISQNTVRAYVKEFAQGGVEALKVVPFKATRHSPLDAHRGTVEAYFQEHPPACSGEARAEIARLTGVKRCPTQVRAFMHRMGMKVRKVAAVPAKVDPVAQEEFKKNIWSHV
jgi:transposase